MVRVETAYPAHTERVRTGEPYFWNELARYSLMESTDEANIRAVIDRAALLNVNRLRVSLMKPRVADPSRCAEPVYPLARFRFLFGPWMNGRPDDMKDPG